MPDPESDTTIETITSAVGRLMDDAWVDHGYTAPNTEVYPGCGSGIPVSTP